MKNLTNQELPLNIFAVLTGLFAAAAGSSAAISLMPRLRVGKSRDNPTSPLYFNDIALDYAENRPAYSDVLHALTGDSDALTRHIAHQVHANASVAHQKYKWANRGVISLFCALVTIGVTALIIGANNS